MSSKVGGASPERRQDHGANRGDIARHPHRSRSRQPPKPQADAGRGPALEPSGRASSKSAKAPSHGGVDHRPGSHDKGPSSSDGIAARFSTPRKQKTEKGGHRSSERLSRESDSHSHSQSLTGGQEPQAMSTSSSEKEYGQSPVKGQSVVNPGEESSHMKRSSRKKVSSGVDDQPADRSLYPTAKRSLYPSLTVTVPSAGDSDRTVTVLQRPKPDRAVAGNFDDGQENSRPVKRNERSHDNQLPSTTPSAHARAGDAELGMDAGANQGKDKAKKLRQTSEHAQSHNEVRNSPRKAARFGDKQIKKNGVTEEQRASNFFQCIPEERPHSKAFPDAKWYCTVCNYHLTDEAKALKHISSNEHRDFCRFRRRFLSIQKLPKLEVGQLEAITEFLESVVWSQSLTCADKHQQVCNDLQALLQKTYPGCSLGLYSSSLNGFGLASSPVCMTVDCDEQGQAPLVLMDAAKIFRKQRQFSKFDENFIIRNPKLSFFDTQSQLRCEISPFDKVLVRASRLLAVYSQLDRRAAALGKLFIYWAELCHFTSPDHGGLPERAFLLMVVYFLQRCQPPVLPVLHELAKDAPGRPDDDEDWFPEDITWLKTTWSSENQQNLAELWLGLLRFYSDEEAVQTMNISVRSKEPTSREDRKWSNKRLAIEEPFVVKFNLGSKMNSQLVFSMLMASLLKTLKYFHQAHTKGQQATLSLSDAEPSPAMAFAEREFVMWQTQLCLAEASEGVAMARAASLADEDCVDGVTNVTCTSGADFSIHSTARASTATPVNSTDAILTSRRHDVADVSKQEMCPEQTSSEKEASCRGGQAPANVTKAQVSPPSSKQCIYKFSQGNLCEKPRSEVAYCTYCHTEGHKMLKCPQLTRNTIPVQKLTMEHRQQLDAVCYKVHEDFVPPKSRFAERQEALKLIETSVRSVYPDADLHLFGSCANGFGFHGSDMDICMTTPGGSKELVASEVVEKLMRYFRKQVGFSDVRAIPEAKVPIVKFTFWHFECDISLENTLALHNTRMLATYANIDRRVTVLGFVLKTFAKTCDIGDASRGTLSSYAYILMMIHFLQQRKPPVLPCLQEIGRYGQKRMVEGWDCWFWDDLDMDKLVELWPEFGLNKESVGQLWLGLLQFYAQEFDFSRMCVSIRRTRPMMSLERMWCGKFICIEDPFNLSHNLGAGIGVRMKEHIVRCFQKAYLHFSTPAKGYFATDVQRQAHYFDVSRLAPIHQPRGKTCRHCGQVGHYAADCPVEQKKAGTPTKGRTPEKGQRLPAKAAVVHSRHETVAENSRHLQQRQAVHQQQTGQFFHQQKQFAYVEHQRQQAFDHRQQYQPQQIMRQSQPVRDNRHEPPIRSASDPSDTGLATARSPPHPSAPQGHGTPSNSILPQGHGMPSNTILPQGHGMPSNTVLPQGHGMPSNTVLPQGHGMPSNTVLPQGHGMPSNTVLPQGHGMPSNTILPHGHVHAMPGVAHHPMMNNVPRFESSVPLLYHQPFPVNLPASFSPAPAPAANIVVYHQGGSVSWPPQPTGKDQAMPPANSANQT